MNHNVKILVAACIFINNLCLFSQKAGQESSTLQAGQEMGKDREAMFDSAFNEENIDVDSVIALPAGLDDVLDGGAGKTGVFDDEASVPPRFLEMLDFLLYSWALEKTKGADCFPDSNVVTPPDSVFRDRLARLPCIMEMPYNSIVQSFINLYTVQKRLQMEYMLGVGKFYFPLFEEVLAANDMPLELKYLPVIESALNPSAYSHMGAAGLWQFMVGTGRMYELEINSLVDERMDPIKSTHAAIRYLKDLYAIYSDWHLVIAAYNCGPGNVRKAISRSGGKRDYWAIYPYLPRETRGYVPTFIAAVYAMEYAPEHNICPAPVELPVISDTIHIRETIHFEQISAATGISVEELRYMNPQYRKNIVPGLYKPYALRLPAEYLSPFIEKYDEIVQHRADELINNRRKEIEIARQSASGSSGKGIYHTVRKGETLGHIALKYGVSVNKLRQWNNIRGNLIRQGQRLKIMK
ncbi:MAG: transglycosylase SLT domain-containing protein [Prevotellaceae bacterium]|jgi:membrane-bound lytic murein transglycosylase D|nr:transglycosylase SLT domain-containing protein [Prevotellaceae bacterium]